jgi:branched-chain amino acid transport system substrate-binding protein
MTMTNEISRRSILYVGAAAAAALAAPAVWAQGTKTPFAFGVALPLTGPAAPGGVDQVQSLQWAVDDINAAGGAGGRPLKLIAVDTQAKPQVGVDAVTRLVSLEKVPLVVCAYSAVVAAVAPIANRSKTLMLVAGANSPRIATMGEYVYTTYPLADVDLTLLAKYVRNEMKKTKAAVIFINDESGVFGAKIFGDTFTSLGGEIVASESYEPNSTDYTGALLKIKAAAPEVIHLQGNAGDSPQVMQQLRQLGISVPITSYNAAYSPQLIRQVGAPADGLIVASLAPGLSDNPNLGPFLERWKREKGREPNLLASNQIVADTAWIVKALVEHLDKAGKSLDGANLRQAMLEIGSFEQPLSGPVKIDDSHRVVKPVYLFEVRNSKFEPLAKYQ